ncbi:MAG: hypothetical protein GY913_21705 [Proteobacteria bacterium]|nr:hypothetical protein [Actinomycetes bacterium]MCP4919526.1 hypothetical protein [Pseudomonadota bacterium]
MWTWLLSASRHVYRRCDFPTNDNEFSNYAAHARLVDSDEEAELRRLAHEESLEFWGDEDTDEDVRALIEDLDKANKAFFDAIADGAKPLPVLDGELAFNETDVPF